MRELFVYWKAPRSMAARVLAELPLAQATLMQRHRGLKARLLRRADEAGDSVTWMETYTAEAGVSTALQSEIEEALAPLQARLHAGPRHTEVFESLG